MFAENTKEKNIAEEAKDAIVFASHLFEEERLKLAPEFREIKDPRLLVLREIFVEEIEALCKEAYDNFHIPEEKEWQKSTFKHSMLSITDNLIWILENDGAYKRLFMNVARRFNPHKRGDC